MPPTMAKRGPAALMFASGVVTLVIWLMPADLDGATTLVTNALDMAIIVPSAIAAGVLIVRGQALGYLIASSLLVLEALLCPLIGIQTAFQIAAGVEFSAAEVIGPITGFTVLALCAIWVLLRIQDGITDEPEP